MRVAFIDHSYHQTTRSSQFFIDAVLQGCEVTRFWDESWNGVAPDRLVASVLDGDFDLILVWQVEHTARLLAGAARGRGANVVFVPMWDGCWTLGDEYWREFGDARILSFSRTLHEQILRRRLFSHHVRYFPDPAGLPGLVEQPGAAVFLWWRVAEIGWPQLRRIFGAWRPDRVHLHVAPDPQVRADALRLPTAEEAEAFGITISRWFEDAVEFRRVLAGCNIFVAPRMAEGIGMAALEAMAAGMCVVAHDAPTMNEYIVSGVNGLLTDMANPRRVDFTAHREMGLRARDGVTAGHAAWLTDLDRLRNFVLAPRETLDRRGFTAAALRDAVPAVLTPAAASGPKVTVATVVRDDAAALADTIHNVALQDYANLEYIVVDGGSGEPTQAVIRANEAHLTRWVSEPDFGPFDAMNKAAALATGDYIIFMNAGDWFAGPDAISRAFRDAPPGADFIFGHHIQSGDAEEQLHLATDFGATWKTLTAERVDRRWLAGVPGHRATFTRTVLLRTHRYDCRYRIAADHEFMYRMKVAGARFFHSLETISVYASGGVPERNRLRLFDERIELAERYGGQGAIDFMRGLRAVEVLQECQTPQPAPPQAGPPRRRRRRRGRGRADDVRRLEAEVERLQGQLDRMVRSNSWRVTSPMRWALGRFILLRALWSRMPRPLTFLKASRP